MRFYGMVGRDNACTNFASLDPVCRTMHRTMDGAYCPTGRAIEPTGVDQTHVISRNTFYSSLTLPRKSASCQPCLSHLSLHKT